MVPAQVSSQKASIADKTRTAAQATVFYLSDDSMQKVCGLQSARGDEFAYSRAVGRRDRTYYSMGRLACVTPGKAPWARGADPIARCGKGPAISPQACRENAQRALCGRRVAAMSTSGQRLDGSGKTALVASRLVLVNDALVRNAVDDALRSPEHLLGSGLVAGGNCLPDFLDCGTQRGAQRGVVRSRLGCLTGTLFGLLGIGHVCLGRESLVICCRNCEAG